MRRRTIAVLLLTFLLTGCGVGPSTNAGSSSRQGGKTTTKTGTTTTVSTGQGSGSASKPVPPAVKAAVNKAVLKMNQELLQLQKEMGG